MKKENPDKKFIPLPNNQGCACNECPYMRLNTLEKIYNALNTMKPEIIMSEELRIKALKPLHRMMELSWKIIFNIKGILCTNIKTISNIE